MLCFCFDVIHWTFSYSHSFSFFFVYESGMEIGDDDAKAIAEALKKNTTLAILDLNSKYHTYSPSFSHDSQFDLASCVCTTIGRSFFLQNAMVFQQDGLSCIVFYCICGSEIV